MRVRTLVVIASLLLPAVSDAQRRVLPPRIGGTQDPARPTPLPGRQPEPIARELAYRRLRVSVESYPMVSYVQSPGLTSDGRGAAWTMFGAGTRAEYRVSRHVSATLDLTSSFLGSPMRIETAELGTRLRPERSERRAYPFVDLRVGYVSAYDGSLGSVIDDPYAFPGRYAYGSRYSRGFGAVAGVGMEYDLTRTLSLTTAASAMRSRLTSQDFQDASRMSTGFGMTSYRYTLGLKYNWVRLSSPPGRDRP